MKHLLTITLTLLLSLMTSHAASTITRIEPANWYAGMKNPTLQLMLTGSGIREASVTTDYPGVTIDSLVRLDSPNYLLLYLNLSGAQPGDMKLRVTFPKGTKAKATTIHYPLMKREKAGEDRIGFSNKDVLYMLMPDRFAQGNPDGKPLKMKTKYVVDRSQPSLRHGGNLEGIRQHLDYFCELGVTALWLTPVLENDSPDFNGSSTYHGYATTDYYRVDPRFGTNEEYRRLCDEAHQKGLKVVMDMIFNHCGMEHPWLSDLPSRDWLNAPEWLAAPKEAPATVAEGQSTTYAGGINKLYLQTNYKLTTVMDPYASSIDRHETVDGWFVPSMPDLNQRNPHVMRYLIQNSIWWIETIGIDGIRMDTYPYADARGMASWMKELNTEYPNFNVVGESWVTEPAFTAALQKDSRITPPYMLNPCSPLPASPNTYLNTVMDFTFFDRLNTAKHEETGQWGGGLNRVYSTFVYDYLYPNPKSVLAFLDNHDTDRFLGDGKDSLMLKQGLALLLTINRIPQLYYGTEIMMNGTKAVTDGNVRQDFPGGFPGDTRNAFTKEGRTKEENSMFRWLSKLLHWRQGNTTITEGRQTQFLPYEGVYVMAHSPLPASSPLPTSPKGEETGKTGISGAAETTGTAGTAATVPTATPASTGVELSASVRQTAPSPSVLLILNGTDKPQTFHADRYRELWPSATTESTHATTPDSTPTAPAPIMAREVTSGRHYDISKDIKLSPRQTLILEF
ncbi:MAG: cyclomaltodextrinase N-terminal domain-containing protein [Prevotella sp.]|nr:cyclomaltodextrinase N-terminal domain-containing protein [Prevotella sp.]